MDLRFNPFDAAGITAITPAGPRAAMPVYARIVDAWVAVEVRRLTAMSQSPDHPVAVEGAAMSAASRAASDNADLDALIAVIESRGHPDHRERGGA